MPSPPETNTTVLPTPDLTQKDEPFSHNTIAELKSKLHKDKDHTGEDVPASPTKMIPDSLRNSNHNHQSTPLLTDEGLIMPRKPNNPVLDNPERQNLHKELMFNKKIGKNVLNQKSELQRVLEKKKDDMARKELENNIASHAPELNKVIADRAKRLQSNPSEMNEDDKVINKEFIQARMKLKNRSDSK